MKRLFKRITLGSGSLALAGWLLWQFAPVQPVLNVAHLSHPAKLATLGPRGANPRLNKIVFWLRECEERRLPASLAISMAQTLNWTREPQAGLVKESLLRNLKIAKELGLFTPENLDRLKRGKAGMVTKGPYARTYVEIDHIVPYSLAKEAGNELANLEMLPAPINRRKSNRVGHRQAMHAQRLYEAGLLSKQSLDRVQSRAER